MKKIIIAGLISIALSFPIMAYAESTSTSIEKVHEKRYRKYISHKKFNNTNKFGGNNALLAPNVVSWEELKQNKGPAWGNWRDKSRASANTKAKARANFSSK